MIKNLNLTEKNKSARQASKSIHVMHVIDKLSVAGSGVHGVGRAIEWWIPGFDPQEFRLSICSLRAPEAAGKVFEHQGTYVFFANRGKFDPRTVNSLLNIIKREQPDILHLHGYGATTFGRIVSFLTGIPNIVHEHTVIDNQPFYQTVADTILSPLTTKAIAISEPVREFMIHRRKVKPKKLETFFYGLPLAEFKSPEPTEVDKKRTELGIFPDQQVVCNVGRLDTQKGQIYLLKAAISILKELPKTRFLIVGEGPDRLMLECFAQREGIAQQVIFTGLRNDIPALLAMSDIAAIPSIWEGGPLTLFEAMNLRKPVVATPVGLMGEVIHEGETGFLVPCHDVALLAEKLIFLLKNPELARTMGEKGWEECQNYDIAHSIERLSEIYRELATYTTSHVT
ncbi:MAG: glycosyltransferase family 4 protein [Pleurocapsa sp. MO_226.B13]|nr:glycosyltransferase family 4 protein [Pleurocapsa sp. MO_226.B13]